MMVVTTDTLEQLGTLVMDDGREIPIVILGVARGSVTFRVKGRVEITPGHWIGPEQHGVVDEHAVRRGPPREPDKRRDPPFPDRA